MKKLILVLFFIMFITFSCATTSGYEEILKSWLGHDVNELLMSWGTPSNEYTMPNGNKMYTWLWVGGSLVTVNYSKYLNMISANQVTYWCKTTFTVNKRGEIIYWRWEGNSCRS